ncbi:FAD-binding protein [Pseudomonas aeruginosa]
MAAPSSAPCTSTTVDCRSPNWSVSDEPAVFRSGRWRRPCRRAARAVRDALARRAPLRIVGGDKGVPRQAGRGRTAGARQTPRDRRHDPCELVITARAGTPLDELQAVLARGGQMLACEAPGFGGRATVGGCSPAACPDRAGPGRERCAISSSARG